MIFNKIVISRKSIVISLPHTSKGAYCVVVFASLRSNPATSLSISGLLRRSSQ